MLLEVAAHYVSIRNVKVSKRERQIMYSITKREVHTKSLQNVLYRYTFCDAVCYVKFAF
jgi:hypothetical protein